MYFKNIFFVVFVIFALFSTALAKPRYHYTSESVEGGDYDNCNGCTIRNNGVGNHNTVIIRHGTKPIGDDDSVFYIREASHNSASSNDDNHEDTEDEDTFGVQSEPSIEQQHQQQRPNLQRPSDNHQQSFGPNTSGQGFYQSHQQHQYNENQETEYIPNPGRNNQGNNYKRGNQGGNGGHYQNNRARSNGPYPGSGNQGGGGGHYQYNGADNNGHYPGSGNQGGGGEYNQNNGGSYGLHPNRESGCPNCYATDFGNGVFNKNIINIEK